MSKPVYIPTRLSGYAHPKCYLSHTNGCSTKITGEHCISRNLLDRLESQNKTIEIVGLSWLPKDCLTSIGKKSLVSNALCCQHNSSLSPLDNVIGDLVDAISGIDAEYRKDCPVGRSYYVDGCQVERWMLKTIIGLIKSGKIVQKSGEPFKIRNRCLALLCEPSARWPVGWGLYVATPAGNTYHSRSFELIPQHNSKTGELVALCLKLNGIAMNFLMGRPGRQSDFGIRRPSKLIFEKGAIKSELVLNWTAHKTGGAITFSHTGIYRGPSPDHQL